MKNLSRYSLTPSYTSINDKANIRSQNPAGGAPCSLQAGVRKDDKWQNNNKHLYNVIETKIMKKTYIQPLVKEEEASVNAICLVVSTTAADNSEVLAPAREETGWEEF